MLSRVLVSFAASPYCAGKANLALLDAGGSVRFFRELVDSSVLCEPLVLAPVSASC
jgi:hypothetical protein